MKPLNTSSSTFANLMEGGFLYVDKTQSIFDLIQPQFAQYFLARPRRFGKSLLISTLKAIFEGRRELFEGLDILKSDYDWKPYPVIHLNMGSCVGQDKTETEDALNYLLNKEAKRHGIKLESKSPAIAFQILIDELSQSSPVVVLIDEYDKPLLGHLGQESAVEVQKLLKSFYGVIHLKLIGQSF